jgi:hypothetical protein
MQVFDGQGVGRKIDRRMCVKVRYAEGTGAEGCICEEQTKPAQWIWDADEWETLRIDDRMGSFT